MGDFYRFKRVEFDKDNQPQVVTVTLEQVSMYHYHAACEEAERRWRSEHVFLDKLIDGGWYKCPRFQNSEDENLLVLKQSLEAHVAECNHLTSYFERVVSRRQSLRKVIYRMKGKTNAIIAD